MFTGLIQDIGEVVEVARSALDLQLGIRTRQLPLEKAALGASIACDGVCLTVLKKTGDVFWADVSAETLAKTTLSFWQPQRRINLETSLRLGDELGGHLVFGHVDGLGECTLVAPEGQGYRLGFTVPDALAPFIAQKGSISINGVSLTVNSVDGNSFGVMIIPHTWEHTTLSQLHAGAKVNIEIDMLARYVARQREWMERAA
jgi:riboflavin synthase